MTRYEITTEQWARFLWEAEIDRPGFDALSPTVSRLGFTREHAKKRAMRELRKQARTTESVQREIFHDWDV